MTGKYLKVSEALCQYKQFRINPSANERGLTIIADEGVGQACEAGSGRTSTALSTSEGYEVVVPERHVGLALCVSKGSLCGWIARRQKTGAHAEPVAARRCGIASQKRVYW